MRLKMLDDTTLMSGPQVHLQCLEVGEEGRAGSCRPSTPPPPSTGAFSLAAQLASPDWSRCDY